ncbi:unnamed protein product [Cylicostephanus goldi]|uniref:Ariadne domain-containing protein n=1 Tax=Cylicostephanus goldi TaxID=71465 RepID=A0A3P7QM63_CYLGO|nr:unnamed protein product [Cylicostephanus goldi]
MSVTENPSVAAEANHVKARRALEKYLHYYERFENHNKSLKLEQQFRDKIQRKIEAKVNDHDGTWIDWQYLHNAATLLTKCRYTLQYTYPFAYFMESGARKQLVRVFSSFSNFSCTCIWGEEVLRYSSTSVVLMHFG